MKEVFLNRISTSDQGTFGRVFTSGFSCFSLELPWRNNKSNISCIPAGEYLAKIIISPKFGRVYLLIEVLGRGSILIHVGNFAGDVSKKFLTHSHGCILFGRKVGYLNNQKAILLSRPAIQEFVNYMGDFTFKFIITEVSHANT